MSVIDPVEYDVRLIRQRIRRQEISETDFRNHRNKIEDSKANVNPVSITDEEPKVGPPNGAAHF